MRDKVRENRRGLNNISRQLAGREKDIDKLGIFPICSRTWRAIL